MFWVSPGLSRPAAVSYTWLNGISPARPLPVRPAGPSPGQWQGDGPQGTGDVAGEGAAELYIRHTLRGNMSARWFGRAPSRLARAWWFLAGHRNDVSAPKATPFFFSFSLYRGGFYSRRRLADVGLVVGLAGEIGGRRRAGPLWCGPWCGPGICNYHCRRHSPAGNSTRFSFSLTPSTHYLSVNATARHGTPRPRVTDPRLLALVFLPHHVSAAAAAAVA